MNDYDIKRGHFRNIDGKIGDIMQEIFGKVEKVEDSFVSSFGALVKVTARTPDKTVLQVDTIMNKDVPEDVAMNTVRKYNEFLLRCTGFNAKQRTKRLKDKAKKGKL